jgi:hypothetical protein
VRALRPPAPHSNPRTSGNPHDRFSLNARPRHASSRQPVCRAHFEFRSAHDLWPWREMPDRHLRDPIMHGCLDCAVRLVGAGVSSTSLRHHPSARNGTDATVWGVGLGAVPGQCRPHVSAAGSEGQSYRGGPRPSPVQCVAAPGCYPDSTHELLPLDHLFTRHTASNGERAV